MKKFLVLAMCAMLALAGTGCGKEKVEENTPTIIEGINVDELTPQELGGMLEEFNTTEDSARKEELGRQIQAILEHVEAQNANNNK